MSILQSEKFVANVQTGTYELPKKHATLFHDSVNCVTTFEI